MWTGHCHITTHFVTVVLSTYSESPASTCHISHCNVHYLSSHSVRDNARRLVLKKQRKVCTLHFLLLAEM
jgi:hypothetical protein